MKKGWEYLWVRYRHSQDAALKRLVTIPDFAIVERVYDAADLRELGIGTNRI